MRSIYIFFFSRKLYSKLFSLQLVGYLKWWEYTLIIVTTNAFVFITNYPAISPRNHTLSPFDRRLWCISYMQTPWWMLGKQMRCTVGWGLAFSCVRYQKTEKLGENKFSAQRKWHKLYFPIVYRQYHINQYTFVSRPNITFNNSVLPGAWDLN